MMSRDAVEDPEPQVPCDSVRGLFDRNQTSAFSANFLVRCYFNAGYLLKHTSANFELVVDEQADPSRAERPIFGPIEFHGEPHRRPSKLRGSSSPSDNERTSAPRKATPHGFEEIKSRGPLTWLVLGCAGCLMGLVLLSPILFGLGAASLAGSFAIKKLRETEDRLRRDFFQTGDE